MIQEFYDPELATDGSVVGFYEREFYMFSNFSSFQVEYDGRLWPTSEHAYQAVRFKDIAPDVYDAIYSARSAHDTYRIAQDNKAQQVSNWSDIKIDVMYSICKAKLTQHSHIKEKLLLTNDVSIIEDSPKDSFWGWGADRQGQNQLSKIWMRLRQELRDGTL